MTEIVTAIQRGSQVYVYGNGQRQLCAVFAGNGPEGGLKRLQIEHRGRLPEKYNPNL